MNSSVEIRVPFVDASGFNSSDEIVVSIENSQT